MLRTDLKIFKSERMTQQADAGGQRTGNEVVNGQLNEVFGNISDIDHAQSAVDIVKIYAGVATADTSLLQDAHLLINEPPIDSLVDVMIIESSAINDASTREDIINAIEGSIIAGILMRQGLSGMIQGQDAFTKADLDGTYAYYDEQRVIDMAIGQRVVIAVEYTGNESVTYPRLQHFCEIIAVPTRVVNPITGTTSTVGNYRFSPALPIAVPDRDVNINGQTHCTVLRAVTAGNAIKAHGVTQLTADAATAILNVEKTSGLLMPRITELEPRLGNAPFASDDTGLVRKTILEPAVSGKFYTINIYDFADIPSNSFSIRYQSEGKTQSVASSDFTGNVLTINLQYAPDPATNISISYYSSDRYQAYNNADALPADNLILSDTVNGSLFFAANNARYTFRLNSADPKILEAARENFGYIQAAILERDGSISYFNGWSAAEYNAIVENQVSAGLTGSSAEFVLAYAEVALDTLYIVVSKAGGGLFTASADNSGVITGIGVDGTVTDGLVSMTFSEPVNLETLSYDVSEVVTLTPPAELYGLNPLRLVDGGKVPLFRKFGVICLSNTIYQDAQSLPAAQVITARPDSFIDIVDSTGASLWHPLDQHYQYDKTNGEITIVDASSFTAPFEIVDTISELALVTAVTDTTLKLSTPLVKNFVAGSIVSGVCQLGDLQARVTTIFDQVVWGNVWADSIIGDPATATFNSVNYPIEVTNESAVNERWVIVFTSSSAFKCIGEKFGQIATGDILNDFAPLNPVTGQPVFIIRKEAWGGENIWQAGNALRINTVSGGKPVVMLRAVSAGHSAIEQDSIRLHFRGNAQ